MSLLASAVSGFVGGAAEGGATTIKDEVAATAKAQQAERDSDLALGRSKALEQFKSDLGIEEKAKTEERATGRNASAAAAVRDEFNKQYPNGTGKMSRAEITREMQSIAIGLGHNDMAKQLGTMRDSDIDLIMANRPRGSGGGGDSDTAENKNYHEFVRTITPEMLADEFDGKTPSKAAWLRWNDDREKRTAKREMHRKMSTIGGMFDQKMFDQLEQDDRQSRQIKGSKNPLETSEPKEKKVINWKDL